MTKELTGIGPVSPRGLLKTPPYGKFATRPSNTFSKAMEKVLEGLLKNGG